MARRIIIEAVACVTKYFVAASVDRGFFLLISMGIIASRLNSRPTHISIRLDQNSLFEEMVQIKELKQMFWCNL